MTVTPKDATNTAGNTAPAPESAGRYGAGEASPGFPGPGAADTPDVADAPRKRGAPKGNSNNMRHGLRAAKLPRDRRHVEHSTLAFRRALEAATASKHGSVSVQHAAYISSAVRHETTAQLAEAWLRVTPDLTVTEKLDIRSRIDAATARRDRAVERLGLDDGGASSPFDGMYGHHDHGIPDLAARLRSGDEQELPDAQEHSGSDRDASDAATARGGDAG